MMPLPPPDQKFFMRKALTLSRSSPALPTNYRVGALLLDLDTCTVLATGYSLELPGNTHAEQCCLMKLSQQYGVPEESLRDVLPPNLALYTTMEPCSRRLSGNEPCVERVLKLRGLIKTVYVGVKEPEKFVKHNDGEVRLMDAGIEMLHVPGLEKEILEVAMAGHERKLENCDPRG